LHSQVAGIAIAATVRIASHGTAATHMPSATAHANDSATTASSRARNA